MAARSKMPGARPHRPSPGRPTSQYKADTRVVRPGGTRARDTLASTFRRFVCNSYDHLGLLVIANLLWLGLSIPIVTAPAATVALFHLARKVAEHEPVTLRDYFVGFRTLFLPALKSGAFFGASFFVIWLNADFYSHLGRWATLPGIFLAALMIWLGAFLLLMNAHAWPLIAYGETRLPAALKKSALLTLDNPAFSIGLTTQALALAALCILTGAGLLLGLGSLTAVLLTTGHRELLKRYFPDSPAALEPPETRTLRDLLRPWESKPRS